MVAYTAVQDFRTNVGAATSVVPILGQPHAPIVHRINWLDWLTESEGGSMTVGDHVYLVEGPMPNDRQQVGLALNLARDDQAFKALITKHPTASTATSNPATGASMSVGHVDFPGGIWTVERVFVGLKTSGGVDRYTFTIGYEKIRLSKTEWLALVHASPNTRNASQLID